MRQFFFSCICLGGLVLLGGCEIPAQTFWSPDLSKAAYIPTNGGKVLVFDEQGKILSTLDASGGGLAWSADSKRLYLAQQVEKRIAAPAVEVVNRMRHADDDSVAAATRPAAPDADEAQHAVIGVWQDGKFTPLFTPGNLVVSHLALSPDQNWLAIVALANEGKEARLYAFSLSTRRLYLLTIGVNPEPLAFTGPNRLAYLEPLEINHSKPAAVGQIVEAELSDQAEQFQVEELAGVVMELTPWMADCGGDLLFTSARVTLPMATKNEEDTGKQLYRYSRAEKSVKAIASDVGPFFALSPNSKLVLFEQQGKLPDGKSRDELAVLDLSNGAVHALAPAMVSGTDGAGNKSSGIVAFAAWRGNDQISFVTPLGADKPVAKEEDKSYYDLGLYQLTPAFELKLIRKLSGDWPSEQKPMLKPQKK